VQIGTASFVDCLLAAETYGRRANFSSSRDEVTLAGPRWSAQEPRPALDASHVVEESEIRATTRLSPTSHEGILTKFPPMGVDLLRG
jgi:hypothetical protein